MRIWMPIRITVAHGVKGGMERQHDSLTSALAGLGHDVQVVTTAHPLGIHADSEAGVRTAYIPATTWRRYQSQWWAESYATLKRLHAAAPFDIILSQSAGGLGYLAQARRELGLPSVVILHGSSQGEVTTAWRGARSPRGVYRLLRLGWRLPRLLWLWRRAAPSVSRWIAVSPSVARENSREIGFPLDRATIVPNGVDTALFRPDPAARARTRERLGLRDAAPVLVVATRLEAEKGVQVALDALTRLRLAFPDLRLLIAGGGQYEGALRARARASGESVTFLGRLPHAELPDILAAADVFIMPSLCHEAFPMSIVEALAAGLPVVASRVGGVPAAITDEVTGRLVPPGDAARMAEAVETLLADPPRRRAMAHLARQAAEARFSLEAMARGTERVLMDAVQASAASQREPDLLVGAVNVVQE